MKPSHELLTTAGLALCVAITASTASAQQCETELAQLLGVAGEPGQFSGLNALAISGETIAICSGNVAVGGYESVHLFYGSGGTWNHLPDQQLFQSDYSTDLPSAWGHALAIRGDRLVVGAPRWSGFSALDSLKGQAVIYRRINGGAFFFDEQLFGPNPPYADQSDQFGTAVAISAYDEVFVSSPYHDSGAGPEGVVYGFKPNGNGWSVSRILFCPDGPGFEFGASLACDGDTLVVGATAADTSYATNAGAAYVYNVAPTFPPYYGKVEVPSAGNGGKMARNVAVAGDWVALSGPDGLIDEGVFLFKRNGDDWNPTPDQTLHGQIQFGASIDMSGSHLVVGSPLEAPTGVAYSYELIGGTWTQDARLAADISPLLGSQMGRKVAVDGLTAVFADPFGDGIPLQVETDRGVSHVFALDGPVGTSYCGGDTPNSTGVPGLLVGEGSDYAVVACLDLVASQLPSNVFGFFVMSELQDNIPNIGGGDGTFCLGSPFYRLPVVQANGAGTVTLPLDFGNLPASIFSGSTWNFQLWYRDGGSSNTTNAIEVTFR